MKVLMVPIQVIFAALWFCVPAFAAVPWWIVFLPLILWSISLALLGVFLGVLAICALVAA